MATWGPVLAAVLTSTIGLLSNVLGIWLNHRLERSGKREPPPYRLNVVDGWGWVSIVAAALTAAVVAFLVSTVAAWIAGAVAVAGWTAFVVWRGWRRMPLLTRETRTWLRAWQAEHGSQGGLPYRQEPAGLAERTYTVQHLSRVADLPGETAGETRDEVLSPDELMTGSAHVLITGEAGVGKSTNLRYFVSDPKQRFWVDATRAVPEVAKPAPGWVSVLLAARDLADKPSIEAGLGSAPEGMLSRKPAPNAKWLLLVDAVDEVLNLDQRQQVWDLLLDAVKHRELVRFVISSRSVEPGRQRDIDFLDVAHYRLHPFTDEQLLAFAIRHQSGRTDPDEPLRIAAETRAARFVAHVRDTGLIDVIRLPLLAKLAADMYFDHGNRDLPMRRVDLYEHSITQWLGKFDDVLENQVLQGVEANERDDVHKLLNRLDQEYSGAGEDRVAVLRAFATRLAFSYTDLTDAAPDLVELAAKLMGVGDSARVPATRLAIGRVLEATGLVCHPYHDAGFWHQTYAEYLAAPLRVAQDGDSPVSTDPRLDNTEYWANGLEDPATRPGLVFVFHHLSSDRQFRVIRDLTGHWENFERAMILVSEGLCDANAVRLLWTDLWNLKPDSVLDLPEQRRSQVNWWNFAALLADDPKRQWELKKLCDSSETKAGDKASALAVLAKHGDDGCRTRLESMVRSASSQRCIGQSGVRYRAELVDAVAMLDANRGVEALVGFVRGETLDADGCKLLLESVHRIDLEEWSAKALSVAEDATVDVKARLNLTEALTNLGDRRGLALLTAMSDDPSLSGEDSELAKSKLAVACMGFSLTVEDARKVTMDEA